MKNLMYRRYIVPKKCDRSLEFQCMQSLISYYSLDRNYEALQKFWRCVWFIGLLSPHTPLHARTYTYTHTLTHTVQYNNTHQHLFELAVDFRLGHAVHEELDVGVASAVPAELLHPRGPETRPVRLRRLLVAAPERVELLQLKTHRKIREKGYKIGTDKTMNIWAVPLQL